MPMDEQAQFVAIVAQYRTPDIRKNDWRILLSREELDPDKSRVVGLEKHLIYKNSLNCCVEK